MTVRTTFLLLSLVAIALSNPVKHTGNVTLHNPLYAYFGPWNLEGDATITINHTVPVIVCVVYAQFGSPNETQYSKDVCFSYQNFTVPEGHMSTFTFPALMSNYSVGVYFANPDEVTKENMTVVEVEISGNTCPDGEYYATAEKMCKAAVVLEGLGNNTIQETFPGSETKFFSIMVPVRVPTVTFKLVDDTEGGQPEDYVISARYNGNPVDGSGPVDHNGTLAIALPLPGTWVFAVRRTSTTAGTARVGVSGESCPVGHAAPDGKNCVQIIEGTAKNSNLSLTITADTGASATFHYWVNASKDNLLWVSVTTFNQTSIPKIYAAYGQIPATDGSNAVINNCNRDYCTTVHSIKYNTSLAEPQDWFVTVQTVLAAGNITFGVWFESDCVTGCLQNNRGQCLPDGTCQCYLDFTGIDCSISEGLGAPYIVLIIIASLVVASAVVGFVAWAYMRRKRGEYETLS